MFTVLPDNPTYVLDNPTYPTYDNPAYVCMYIYIYIYIYIYMYIQICC